MSEIKYYSADDIFNQNRKKEDLLLKNKPTNSNDGDDIEVIIPSSQENENSAIEQSLIPKNTPKFTMQREQLQAIFSSPSILKIDNKRKSAASLEKNLMQEKFKKIVESQSPAEMSFKASRSVLGGGNEARSSTPSNPNIVAEFNVTLDKFNDNKSKLKNVCEKLKRTNEIVQAFRTNLTNRYRIKGGK